MHVMVKVTLSATRVKLCWQPRYKHQADLSLLPQTSYSMSFSTCPLDIGDYILRLAIRHDDCHASPSKACYLAYAGPYYIVDANESYCLACTKSLQLVCRTFNQILQPIVWYHIPMHLTHVPEDDLGDVPTYNAQDILDFFTAPAQVYLTKYIWTVHVIGPVCHNINVADSE